MIWWRSRMIIAIVLAFLFGFCNAVYIWKRFQCIQKWAWPICRKTRKDQTQNSARQRANNRPDLVNICFIHKTHISCRCLPVTLSPCPSRSLSLSLDFASVWCHFIDLYSRHRPQMLSCPTRQKKNRCFYL